MKSISSGFLALILIVFGMRAQRAPDSIPLYVPHTNAVPALFEKLTASSTGIELTHQFPTNAPFEMLIDQCSGAGICAGDYDGDGWPDLFMTHYNLGNRLYRNLGGFRFTNITERAGVAGRGSWSTGATFVDIDNDGDLDLFVSAFNAPNLLYINQGKGAFQEQARAWGLDFTGASVMMAFGDYDRDGFLDGYLVTHRLNTAAGHSLPRSAKEAVNRGVIQVNSSGQIRIGEAFQEMFSTLDKGNGRTELIIAGQQDYLYHNNGNGTFSISNLTARIQGCDIGLAASWWDFNADGWPDLYVSNDYRGPDRLYRNDRNGTFTEVTSDSIPHVPWASMGSDNADINNDGYMDFLAADMSGFSHQRRQISMVNLEKDRWFLERYRQYPRNALYLGTGTSQVLEVAQLAGLANTDWTWSPKFADLDNDGRIDLFLTTGMSRDFVNNDLIAAYRERGGFWRNAPVLRQANLAYRNMGDVQFAEVGHEWGLDQVSASYGAALADLDRDGDLDLVVANFDEPVSVYRNHSHSGNRVLIRLQGTHGNTWGIGAMVRAVTAAGMQTRCLGLSQGFASSNEPLLHFGLGECGKIDHLSIKWPSGVKQSLEHLKAGQFYTIIEPESAPDSPRSLAQEMASPIYMRAELLAEFRHREKSYDDFQREPLLPWKLSQMGPGLAIGGVSKDKCLYLSGAAGQSGMLAMRDSQGRYRAVPQPAFEADQACEDMGACFFDADGDGDQDLYVVSGGVEVEPGNSLLQDRLYLNDGHDHFSRTPLGGIPTETDSGSSVAAADFDRDGDLDLFVGGASIPGTYPLPARSHLLVNHQGRFTDRIQELAPGLELVGVVMGAIWSDVDGDGWLDLLIALHWDSIKLFLNRRGRLEDGSAQAGLAELSGLWNGISGGDLDGDGDMDYVITNFGLNTRYQASLQFPMLLCYGSFEESGERQMIEAYYEPSGDSTLVGAQNKRAGGAVPIGVLRPLRGKTCLTRVIPSLAAKFPTFDSYARASLTDLVAPELLEHARRFAVTTLESGVLLNNGSGHFKFVPLPRLAQTAPSFGTVIVDVNGDGKLDLCLAQNFFGPQPETGRMDGGLGMLLKGCGDGSFECVWPQESGLQIPGEARGLVAADLNEDGWPDLVMGMNNDSPLLLTNRGSVTNRIFRLGLSGRPGNPTALGSRVTVIRTDGTAQAAEIRAGGGYLSQTSSHLTFGLGPTSKVQRIQVRWPDGQVTTENPRSNQPLEIFSP